MSVETVVIDKELEDLIPGFIKNRHKDVARLRAALATSDLQLLAGIGHEMKGIGGGYGFPKITHLGDQIEVAAKESQIAAIATLVDELDTYIQTVKIEFSA